MTIICSQYHRGRMVKERWVFGMVDMSHPTKPIFTYVPKRDAETLIRIIERHIPAGSTIVSDQWRAYASLQHNAAYQYLTVNHSRNFVDPRTGECIIRICVRVALTILL